MIADVLNDIQIDTIQVYLFGSAKYSMLPNDIDILLVYNESLISINCILQLRKILSKKISLKTGKQVDICLLSTAENEYQIFIKQEKAKMICYTKPNFQLSPPACPLGTARSA